MYVNAELLEEKVLERASEYSEGTVLLWVKDMGYKHDKYKKGVYVDGHEREDIVEYRNEYLRDIYLIRHAASCLYILVPD